VVKSQLVEFLDWKSVDLIPSPNLAPTPSSECTGSEILAN
jgi:hypothetical protein